MACTPLTVDAGLFIDVMSTSWSTAPNTAQGGKTVTRSSAGLTVTGPTGSLFMPTLGGHVLKYMFFGAGNFLVVLDSETGVGSITHRVFIIDFTTAGGPTDRLVLTGLASSSAVPPPNVQFSQGIGSAVLLFNSTGTEIQNLAIFRSDTGATLCAGPPPFVATGETQGEATATQLKIHYSSGGTSQTVTCPLPAGNCQVTPALPPSFPTAVVGGPASLATTTSVFTIHNNGTDCLTINAIGNVAPFSVAATSQPLPASLIPGQSMTVTVRFAPTMVGSFGPVSLPITRIPARGDSALVCRGTARAPIPHLTVSPSSLAFGSVPVTTNANRSLTLVNNGELPLTVDVPASPAGSPFQWAQFSGLLAVGANHVIQVTFSPVAEGGFSASLGISTTPAAGPTSVAINGSGCIANAVIVPAPVAPINFGRVQQGLRMARFLRFRNIGDGRLTFNARLTGPDAALYGLSTGSLTATAATQPYSADPITPCGPGPAGSGEAIVALVFFADGAPRTTAAQLIVDGHNGTNATPASWTYDLSAEVVSPIPTDAAIVLDRSGSMADLAGSRAKSEAAVAGGKLFAELARPGLDRLAVVRFNQLPDVLQTIIDVTAANQAGIVGTISPAALTPTGATSIAAGAMTGLRELASLRSPAPPQLTRAMVVLTDGLDNTAYQNPTDSRWYSVLGGSYRTPAGPTVSTDPVPLTPITKVYGIGLGPGPNLGVAELNRLSSATGAYYGVVGDLVGASYFNLEKYFTQIYMDAVGISPLLDPVYTIAAGKTQRIEFDVLRGDVSVLVVVYDRDGGRLPFHLRTPTGEIIDVSFVSPVFPLRRGATPTARFVEARFPQGDPTRYAGRWAVEVRHPGRLCFGDPQAEGQKKKPLRGFVTSKCRGWRKAVDYGVAIGVRSNFTLVAAVDSAPTQVSQPIQLTALVSEANLPVTGCNVAVQATSPAGSRWDVELLDDGASGDGGSDDGEYGLLFRHTGEEGSYEFVFRVDGLSRDGERVHRESAVAKYVEGRLRVGPYPDPCRDYSRNEVEPRS